ncbi:hypothetical protein CLU79DRAFT_722451 [Phycomyces nitens]|nr:hypothetical protein CLU79DRAFT_722451 [Phycomyces nitens]
MPDILPYIFRGRLAITIILLAVALISVSTAAPIGELGSSDEKISDIESYLLRHFTKAQVDAFKTLKTVLLAYLAHAATVRVDSSTKILPSLYKRLSALAWPTSGVYEAYGSIHKVNNADAIFGFNNIANASEENSVLKDFEDTPLVQTQEMNHSDNVSQLWRGVHRTVKVVRKDNYTKEEIDRAFEKSNRRDHDNVITFKKIFKSIHLYKQRHVRNCILNGSLYIGTDTILVSRDGTSDRLETKDMTITGPGANCKYQLPVHPTSVRYFPEPMLRQLELAHGIQNTFYFQIAVSFIQLCYTVYECLEGSGQKWSKIIMIIFMAMSAFQTLSAYVLPTQVAAYSVSSMAEFTSEKDYFKHDDLSYVHPVARTLLRFFPKSTKKIFIDRESILYDVMYKIGLEDVSICAVMKEPKKNEMSVTSQSVGYWEAVVIAVWGW